MDTKSCEICGSTLIPNPGDLECPTCCPEDARKMATYLASKVEKWYVNGKVKRDQIAAELREAGRDDLADEIIWWFENGDKRFGSIIKRLRDFST